MYVETPADHDFSAFLAGLTPSRVLRDRERNFSKVERKRQRFLREKSRTEHQVGVASMFTPEQLAVAIRVFEAQKESK